MTTEVAIIGAGPIGLAVGAELKRRGRRVLILEKGPIGRTIHWYPRGMRFNSSAANLELLRLPVPSTDGEKPTREEYLAYLRDFVRYHELSVRTYEEVLSISGERGNFEIGTRRKNGDENLYRAARVVLAIGSNDRPRLLGIPGENLPHVSHYLTDPHDYHGQRVVIVGGRNSAAEAAIRLTSVGARVTMVHRREEFDVDRMKYWIAPEFLGMISRGRIETVMGATVTKIDQHALHADRADGTPLRIEADFVLLLVGYIPDYTLIDQLDIATHHEQREPVVDPQTLETNRPGVFCAGTIVAGDQNPYRVFIENALHHPQTIADTLDRES